MDKYICECCGGKINPRTMECEYCGTAFKRSYDDQIIRIETFRNPVQTIAASTIISHEMLDCMGAKEASEYALRGLVHKLSEGIAPFMVVQSGYEPEYRAHKVEAVMKIVIPKEGIENWRGIE